jgi:hypothetical protein
MSVTMGSKVSRAGGELAKADQATGPAGDRASCRDRGLPTPVDRSLRFLLRNASKLMRRRFVHRAREVGLNLNGSEAVVLVYVS